MKNCRIRHERNQTVLGKGIIKTSEVDINYASTYQLFLCWAAWSTPLSVNKYREGHKLSTTNIVKCFHPAIPQNNNNKHKINNINNNRNDNYVWL